ncbi:MAG: hypothetical protein RIQ93_549 [Verrucomicrobiota bacterium]|jgi:hypothetical protein
MISRPERPFLGRNRVAATAEQLQVCREHALVALALLVRHLRAVTASPRWKIDYQLGEPEMRGGWPGPAARI